MYALLISRQEGMLVKPSMKPHIIHITVIPLVSLHVYLVVMLLWYCLKCLATLAVQAAHTIKYNNLSIALYQSYTLYILMTTNII